MKKTKFFLLLCLVFPQYVFAVFPVIDATAVAKLAGEIEQLSQIYTQLGELTTHTQLLNQELAQLTNSNWSTAQTEITDLGNVINKTNTIAYNASDIDGDFRKVFPGYQSGTTTTYSDQYKTIITNTQNTLNSVLQSVGASASDFSSENGRLVQLQGAFNDANGQTKAIQAAAQIASEQVSQLQLLRQTVIAQTNAQNTYYAAEIQKEASAKQAFDNFVETSQTGASDKLDQNPIDDPFDK
jgi:P-type conjugative transfer protein TrbJ